MASSRFVNALQVEFESVLTLEHTGMTRMFKSLEDAGLKGFLEVPTSVYEDAVTEFFVNPKVIAVMILSFVCNKKMAITEDVFSTTFRLPTEGMTGFLDIPKDRVMEIHSRYSATDVPFRARSKKSKRTEDTASNTEGGESKRVQPVGGKKKQGGTKRKQIVESSDSGSISLPLMNLAKKKRTQRPKIQQRSIADKGDSQPCPIPGVLAGGAEVSGDEQVDDGPGGHERSDSDQDVQRGGDELYEENLEYDTQMDHRGQNESVSTTAQDEPRMFVDECLDNITEKETDNLERAIVVRSGHELPAPLTMTYTGQGIFAPIQIREINWVPHFLPKIAPTDKGKVTLEDVARPNPVEEHCQLELKDIAMQHRAQRVLPGLTIVAPESSLVGSASGHSQFLTLEFSSRAEQEQAETQEPIEQIVQQINENEAVNSQEHQTHENEPLVQAEEHPALEIYTRLKGPSPSNHRMVVYTADSEEDTRLSFLNNSESSHTGSQRIIFSPPDRPHANSKLDGVDKVVPSIDSRMIYMESKLTSLDSRTLYIDSKMHSMDSKLHSLNSNIEQLMDTLTSLKLDFGRHKHQHQLTTDLDMIKLQLVELVEHLKRVGDAKKGEGGQSRPVDGSSRPGGEGPSGGQSSIRGRGPSPRGGRGPSPGRPGEDSERFKYCKWF
ncbi:hypothetical protein F511_15525 [Dorcoceras hygrometricum]|uniref:Uncharacterized protein n=1 Tax=Dorcoceras hygrometricum TaxID=472368 RepID=A0A2Z7ANN5_9LAMI|nr:hypothetical protein F511_15525 [Dorcoceras hygrometricum]